MVRSAVGPSAPTEVEVSVDSKITTWLPSRITQDHERAWDEFLKEFAPLILQVVHLFERDLDRIDDCFVFVCEKLKRDNLKRIRRFDISGAASFPTWLRAVVRNLCLDWRRKRFGRPRLYRSIARLPEREREIFRCVHQQGLGENETFHTLKALYPALTRVQLAEGLTHIEHALSSHQEWLLTTRRPRMETLSRSPRNSSETGSEREIPASGPDPEEQASQHEYLTALRQALSRLTTQQRLLVRLRYEQELSLEQIARLTQMETPLKVQRALYKAIETIREEMQAKSSGSMSVKDS